MSKRHDRFRVPHNRDVTARPLETEYFSTDERVYRRRAVSQGCFLDGESNAVQPGGQPRAGIAIALSTDLRSASCGMILQSATTCQQWADHCPWWNRNRLILQAFIKALAVLSEPHLVIVNCASDYLVPNLMEGYAHEWRRQDWKKPDGAPAKNSDLWKQVLAGCDPHLIRVLYPTVARPIDPQAEQLALTGLIPPGARHRDFVAGKPT